jgi:site-specific DNA-adenine methylase
VRYVGSKKRLKKVIVPIINKIIEDNNITEYKEPFVGGANIIQWVECENRTGNDINKYLIAMYNELQKGWVPMTLEEMVQSRLKPGEEMDLFDKEQANRFYNEVKYDFNKNILKDPKYADIEMC